MLLDCRTDLTDFFREQVDDAKRSLEIGLEPEAEHYVVILLVRTAERADETPLDRPLVLQWKDAIEEVDVARRFMRFRGMGDSALLTGGMFPESHEARGVTETYICGLGRRAYAEAARNAPSGLRRAGVFDALAATFDEMVRVLLELRERARTEDTDPAQLLAAVLRHGSPTAARQLAERGLVAVVGDDSTN